MKNFNIYSAFYMYGADKSFGITEIRRLILIMMRIASVSGIT